MDWAESFNLVESDCCDLVHRAILVASIYGSYLWKIIRAHYLIAGKLSMEKTFADCSLVSLPKDGYVSIHSDVTKTHKC